MDHLTHFPLRSRVSSRVPRCCNWLSLHRMCESGILSQFVASCICLHSRIVFSRPLTLAPHVLLAVANELENGITDSGLSDVNVILSQCTRLCGIYLFGNSMTDIAFSRLLNAVTAHKALMVIRYVRLSFSSLVTTPTAILWLMCLILVLFYWVLCVSVVLSISLYMPSQPAGIQPTLSILIFHISQCNFHGQSNRPVSH